MDTQTFIKQFWQLVEKHINDRRDSESPVQRPLPPEKLQSLYDLELGASGTDLEELLAAIQHYFDHMPRTDHPLFVNQLYGGVDIAAMAGEMATAAANTSMATYEIAPVATLMEDALIRKMMQFTGYRQGDGIFCTGGSNGNLLGLLNARHHRYPETKMKGLYGMPPHTIFISETAHYSFRKSANALGFGVDNVIHVPTDERGRMIPTELRLAIRSSRARGEVPFFIGATCGTTVLGAFDPLKDLAEIAADENCWLHADGAWGGPVLLSKQHRDLMDGVELTDSISWDAHKLMGAPLISTAFLVRHDNLLHNTACDAGTEYIFHDVEHQFDTGVKSLQCGRKVDSLKTWLLWKHLGDDGFARKIDGLFDLAEYAARRVESEPELELQAPVQFVNVCFRYNNGSIDDLDRFNTTLRSRLMESGEVMINQAKLGQERTIRLVLQQLEHGEEHVDRFFDLVVAAGRDLAASS